MRSTVRMSAVVAIAFLLFSTTACASLFEKDMAAASFGPADAAMRVLVAATDSPYKRAIIQALADGLTADGVAVDVVPLGQFDAARQAKDYKALVLVATIKAGQEDSRVVAARAALKGDSRLVILNTAGGSETKGGVDSVTAASDSPVNVVVNPALAAIKALP